MDSIETFYLRWNEYEPNLKREFSQLRHDEDFYDVTIACGGNTIKAHKVILGACSVFFKSLFKSVSHQHPLLYLGGINFSSLESVITFIYNGEVRVKSDELDRFISVAQELQVNGLLRDSPFEKKKKSCLPKYKENSKQRGVKRKSLSTSSIPPKQKLVIQEENADAEIQVTLIDQSANLQSPPSSSSSLKNGMTSLEENDVLEIQEITPIDTSSNPQSPSLKSGRDIQEEIHDVEIQEITPIDHSSSPRSPSSTISLKSGREAAEEKNQKVTLIDEDVSLEIQETKAVYKSNANHVPGNEEMSDLDQLEQVDELLNNQISKLVSPCNAFGKYECLKCPYTNSLKLNVQRHVKAKHSAINGYPCNKCHRRSKTMSLLMIHKKVYHKED